MGIIGPGVPVSAAGPDPARAEAQQLAAAASAVSSDAAAVARLRAQAPAAVAIDQVRAELALVQAAFTYREAVRQEQELVYALASQTDLEHGTLPLLPAPRSAQLTDVDGALRALWRLSGLTPGGPVSPRHNHRFADAEPVDSLLGYYREAAARAGIDWTYLAAINFIESDFGRNDGPSSAGALGPMQFLPATFQEYGAGGDIMSPHDSILAAARLLARNGAPGDYGRALMRYNHSQDYVAGVEGYAAAMRSDPTWLNRFYYWSTYG